jgi:hypothetical protein
MKRSTAIFLVSILLIDAALLTSANSTRLTSPASLQTSSDSSHDHPPAELPATLDPRQFQDNRTALVAYTLASQLKEVLYQAHCYCGCDKELGHKSLLDCFTSRHGVLCHTCQKELIFCYLQHKKGKSPTEIRNLMAKGKASRIDLAKYTDRLYRRIEEDQK